MHLPDRLIVRLRPIVPPPAQLEGILIGLDTHVEGRYYWGTIIGLTDTAGSASVTATKLAADFASDQALFPMDYKVPLRDCDPQVTVRISGGRAFTSFQATIRHQPLAEKSAQELWLNAKNSDLKPSHATASCSTPTELLEVTLEVSTGR